PPGQQTRGRPFARPRAGATRGGADAAPRRDGSRRRIAGTCFARDLPVPERRLSAARLPAGSAGDVAPGRGQARRRGQRDAERRGADLGILARAADGERLLAAAIAKQTPHQTMTLLLRWIIPRGNERLIGR